MRILRVRGENLGSLERFEIDFTAAPLSGSGLFAIVGPTGAGKSTVLDALTLALYGDYPRVSGSGTAKVPDPSGQSLGSNDPRAILRRGAGSGYAECEFVGVDNDGYCARWSVSRAHGRVAGNIQSAGRVVSRLSDGGVVASGITDASRAIAALTGLDFGQFRRLVLLAQGDFDAFLMASEHDRVTLLERITDTEVYTQLSVRVHQGTQARWSKVDRLRERLDGVDLMASEQREALAADIEAAKQSILEMDAEAADLHKRIEVTSRVAKAEMEAASATQTLDEALSHAEANAAERSLIESHDRAEPLRPFAMERSRTERECARLAHAAVNASGAEALLAQASAEAARRLAQAERIHEDAERAVVAATPVWAEAGRLDDLCRDAERDVRAAAHALAERGVASGKCANLADAARSTVTDMEDRRVRAAARLEATAAHDPLADDTARIHDLFASHADALAQVEDQFTLLAEATAKAGAARSAIEATAAARLALDARRATIDGELAVLRSRRLSLDVPSLHARKAALGHATALVAQQARTHRVYVAAVAKAAEARRDEVGDTVNAAEAEARRLAAESSLRAKEAERRGMAEAVALAEGVESDHAVALRPLLVEGQPCPVCGAVEHGSHAAASLEAFGAKLRAKVGTLATGIEQASLSMAGAAAEASASRARAEQAGRRIVDAEREMEDARASFVAKAFDLAAALTSAAVPETSPGIDDAQPEETWSAISSDLGEVARPVAEGVAEAERLGREIDDAVGRREQVQEQIEGVARQGEDATNLAQTLAVEIASTDARVGQARRAAETAKSALTRYLDAAAITNESFEAAPEKVASCLDLLGAERRDARDAKGKADADVAAATNDLRTAETNLVEAEAAHRGAEEALDAATRVLEGYRTKRAELLEGEGVTAHRTKVEGEARTADQQASLARTTHALAARDAVAAAARVREADEAASESATLATAATEAWIERCDASGMSEQDLLQLFATPRDRVEGMRAHVSLLLQAVRDAEAVLGARRRDLEAAVADALGMDVPEDGEVRLDALRASIEERTLARGAFEGTAAADDERRERAEGLRRDLSSAETDWAVWAKVNEAIGSANGKKFSRLAQEVTLEALVSLANEQLDLIAPRYHLVRGDGLALHVSDIEMGGEPRGARSLSGGERFLVSLGLALALSGLEGRHGQADLLLVDEGFGSLDAGSLDVAIEALEHLQAQGRRVGVVTHVAGMAERIPTQVRVTKRGGGRSVVEVTTS